MSENSRVVVKPGKYSWAQWPVGHVVEVGPVLRSPGMYGRDCTTYEVFLDGKSIGSVAGEKREANVPTGPGNRLRRVVGHPLRWSYQLGRVTPFPDSRLRYDTRVQAIALLVKNHLEADSIGPSR